MILIIFGLIIVLVIAPVVSTYDPEYGWAWFAIGTIAVVLGAASELSS